MKFCSSCGSEVISRVPDGDNRKRFVCTSCGEVHYQNPKVVVGTIPIYQAKNTTKVLLCRRAIEPRLNYWTLPAGFLENDETTLEGALRESSEEACVSLQGASLYRVLNVSGNNQIHIFFRAVMTTPEYATTTESSDVALFDFEEIPWRQLAFPTVHRALSDFVDEYQRAEFTIAMIDISREDWRHLDKG